MCGSSADFFCGQAAVGKSTHVAHDSRSPSRLHGQEHLEQTHASLKELMQECRRIGLLNLVYPCSASRCLYSDLCPTVACARVCTDGREVRSATLLSCTAALSTVSDDESAGESPTQQRSHNERSRLDRSTLRWIPAPYGGLVYSRVTVRL